MRYDTELKNLNLIVSDGTNRIQFDLDRAYTRNVFMPNTTVENENEYAYDAVQLYLNSIPPSQQQQAFNILADYKQFNDTFFTHEQLVNGVPRYIERFLSVPGFRYEDIKNWVMNNINVPSTIADKFVDNLEYAFTQKQTYLRHEYVDLCVLAITMKLLVPMLAGYMVNISQQYGQLKELVTLNILPKVLTETPGYRKLYEYVGCMVDPDNISIEMLFKVDVTSETVVDWVFSHTLLRRVVSASLLQTTDNRHIVSYVYSHLYNKTNNNSVTTIRDKRLGHGGDDEDATSVYDSFRFKGKLTLATQAELIYSANEDYYLPLVKHLINVDEYIRLRDVVVTKPIFTSPVHIRILKWVLAPLITHKAFYMIDSYALKRLMVLTYCLIKDDHPYLGLIMLSTIGYDTNGEPILHEFVTRNRSSKEEIDELKRMYPIFITGGKIFPILKLIDTMSKDLIAHWEVLVDKSELNGDQLALMSQHDQQVIVREDSKRLLLALIKALPIIPKHEEKQQ